MRPFLLLMFAVSLLAQPALGWQRIVCRDGSSCPEPAATQPLDDEHACCIPAPCESQPIAPVSPCTLSAPPPRDVVPSAPGGDEIGEPVFLSIATIPFDPPAHKSARVADRDDPQPASSVPRRLHAPRAPPRAV